MTRPPVIVITGRHRPHELAWLGYSALAGLSILLAAPAPTSVLAVMSRGMVVGWGVLLLLSGVFGLWAALGRRRALKRRLADEMGAMFVNAAALVAFSVAILIYAPKQGWFVAGATAVWAGANIWRAQQIRHDLDAIRKAEQP